MIPVSVWYRKNRETKQYDFNHIDNDPPQDFEPIPINDYQKKAWKGCSWICKEGFLNDNFVLTVKGKS